MDYGVGRLLDWLDAHGQREDTVICFSSDNGFNMGHHGITGKGNATFPQNMYEESVRVPFIMAGAGIEHRGAECNRLLSHYDFLPTILDHLGLPALPPAERAELPGRTFAHLLRRDGPALTLDPADSDATAVVYDEYGGVRMIRTPCWKYVHRATGPHELYHLARDPGEARNLCEAGAAMAAPARAKLAELRSRLEAWFARHVQPERDGAALPVTGSGQGLRGPTSFHDPDGFFRPAV